MSLKNVGVLWKNTSKENKEYLSGTLDLGAFGQSRIMIFQNENKKEENHPDFRVSLATDEPKKTK